jgi:glycosyltransferase involved in cell wall biosynthesis
MRVVAILPALNEEASIGAVVRDLTTLVERVIVVDNGSTDDTRGVAERAGATVVREPERGYGAACLAGVDAAHDADAFLFMDADGSDDPADAPKLIRALTDDTGIVLGVRPRHLREKGSMTRVQTFGNWFAPFLLRNLSKARYTDLPPFKLVRRDVFTALNVTDRRHGFTVQLLLKAHRKGVRVVEVPVQCLARKGGVSKVSGTLSGSARAGVKILATVTKHVISERLGVST